MLAKSPTSSIIDHALKVSVTPLLQAHSYQKLGRTYHDDRAPVVTMLQFQSSMHNNPNDAQFTINLRITFPYYHVARSGEPYPKNPSKAFAFVDERIGFTMPNREDHWWSVSLDSNPSILGQSVASAICDCGLPFLNTHADLNRICDIIETNAIVLNHNSNSSIDLAIIQAYNGNPDIARRIIDEQIAIARSSFNPRYEQNLLGVYRRLSEITR